MPYVGFAFTNSALDFLESLPPKIRRQVAKRAKALLATPHPQSSKKLQNVETPEGEPVYRERSGDYRILYVVRANPQEVIILDIDHRKEVYRMPKTKTEPVDEMRMKDTDFDAMMCSALGVSAPDESDTGDENAEKRVSAYPPKSRKS